MQKISMEIERKFLIKRPIENYKDYPCREIEQAYLSLVPEIRVRRDNDNYYLTYKSDGELSREEYNLPLTQDAYNHLLKKADGNIISKKRYMIPIKHSELVVELDIFEGKFDGLILAEVEFETVYDANNFSPPSWFGEEVTCDNSYKNKNLAKYKEKYMDDIDIRIKESIAKSERNIASEQDMLRGNINRMLVTKDVKELYNSYKYANERLDFIFRERLNELKN